MSNDEVAGRLVVLEIFSMTALGLYLANSRNDPDYQKADALIVSLERSVAALGTALAPGEKAAAEKYAEHLAGTLRANLRNMRGEGGLSH